MNYFCWTTLYDRCFYVARVAAPSKKPFSAAKPAQTVSAKKKKKKKGYSPCFPEYECCTVEFYVLCLLQCSGIAVKVAVYGVMLLRNRQFDISGCKIAHFTCALW